MKRTKTFLLIARTIKYCARAVLALILTGEAYLFIVRPDDDIAGGVFMGLLVIVASGGISIIAEKFEKRLLNH